MRMRLSRPMPALLALGLIAGASGRAQAELVTVAFSYTFTDGETLAGTVRGDLQSDGDRVLDLGGLSATYSGSPGSPFVFTTPPQFGTGSLTLSGSGSFSFFGFALDPDTQVQRDNLGFNLSSSDVSNAVTVGTFATGSTFLNFPPPGEALEAEPFARGSYSASVVPAAVPEPGSLAMLGLGLVGLGYAGWRRRKAKATA